MKFSEQWLREWVNPPVSTEALAEQLTMAGLEVDAIEPVAGDFDKVVVGEVTSVEPHPDADKLRVCQVNVGESSSLSIVCGAPNVAKGMKAPTALVGAKLPGGLKIKKSKLRGVESHGMLCSAKELGLAEQAEGLMPLAADAPVGEDIRRYLGLDDVSIELGLTPNRGDCLGLEGVAREVGVLNQMSVTAPTVDPVPAQHDDALPVRLEAASDCPQYCGRIIRGVDPTARTPLWMQERLRRSGIRSIAPVVDVTNYVLLELGQPMHAFDLAKLEGGISVRHAKTAETLLLLDGQTIELAAGTLVIADEKKPLALAGIMGGEDSAVHDDTRDIFLESAFFQPLAIAGKARQYGLHTDSSHRFERGVSPQLQRRALERATSLLLEIVGGEPGPVIEANEPGQLPRRAPVKLRESRISRVLGLPVSSGQVADILSGLELSVKELDGGWEVTPPAFRFDLEREEDLIEEVARIYGYNRLTSQVPRAPLELHPLPEAVIAQRQIKQMLVDLGYQEAVTYSFVDNRLQQLVEPEVEALPLANPLSSEMGVMRTSLWPGLVQSLQNNLHRQQNRLWLFECGLKFVPQATELKQELVLAGLLSGDVHPPQWGQPAQPVDFFDAKGHLELLFARTGRPEAFRFEADAHPALHPGQSARIWRGEVPVGWLGTLHPRLKKELDINQTAILYEIDLKAVAAGSIPEYTPVSRFPAIRQDLSLVMDEGISAQKVQDTVWSAAPEWLRHVELFDVYTGEGIDSGRKSLSLGLTFQDLSRTLTDTEVDDAKQKIVGQLEADLGATLR